MTYINRRWTLDDLSFALEDEGSEGPVITVQIVTPVGRLLVMSEVEIVGRRCLLSGLHIQGETVSPNAIGPANLLVLAQFVMQGMDFDEIVVQGAIRTTGANPGYRPRSLRFTRRIVVDAKA